MSLKIYLSHVVACTCQRLTHDFVFYSDGQLGPHASSFNSSKLKRIAATIYNTPIWRSLRLKRDLVDSCHNSPSTSLTARQQAIYCYIRFRWSLLAGCDSVQAAYDYLDEEGMRRRTEFLLGTDAMSPSNLFPFRFSQTQHNWGKCGHGIRSNQAYNTPKLKYEAAVRATKCLMQDYINNHHVNVYNLFHALSSRDADEATAELLKGIVESCGVIVHTGSLFYKKITSDQFIDCWITQKLIRAAKQEAAKIASEFPEGCSFRLDKYRMQGYTS